MRVNTLNRIPLVHKSIYCYYLTIYRFIVKLSKRIQMRSTMNGTFGPKTDDNELFHKTFPYFIWLLRDITQAIPSDCNGDIKKYFLKKVRKKRIYDLQYSNRENVRRIFVYKEQNVYFFTLVRLDRRTEGRTDGWMNGLIDSLIQVQIGPRVTLEAHITSSL